MAKAYLLYVELPRAKARSKTNNVKAIFIELFQSLNLLIQYKNIRP